MKTNHIITGDACDVLPELPDAAFQAIIADPPYYNVLTGEAWDTQWPSEEAYLTWSLQWVRECMRLLKDDGLFFCFGQLGKREHVFIHLMSRLCAEFQFHDLVIWDRAVGYNERRDSFTPAYEMILVLRQSQGGDRVKFIKDAVRVPYDEQTIAAYLKDPRYKNKAARHQHLQAGKYATNLLRVPSLKGTSKEKCGHPSQKPAALIEKLILCSTDVGDTVLDAFLGSGTTAAVAQTLGRQWVGVEVNPHYVEMADQRMAGLLQM